MAMPNPISSPMSNAMQSAPAGQTLQLHDIHIPEQVSNFPIAPGWWILLTLIVISALLLYKKIKQRKQLNAIKQQALTLLNNNQAMTAKECISLLKWAAMHYFSRQHLAKLYGDSFQLFLIQQLPETHQDNFKNLSNAGFISQYQEDVEANADKIGTCNTTDSDCQQATKLWITYALPVNKANSLSVMNEPLEDKSLEKHYINKELKAEIKEAEQTNIGNEIAKNKEISK